MGAPGPRLMGVAPGDPGRVGRSFYATQTGVAPGANSQQIRTFALLDRLSAMFRAFANPYGYTLADTDPTTLDTGYSADAKISDWHEYFRADNSRMQVYEDVDEMDDSTDEVTAAMDTIADSAVNPEDGSDVSFVVEIDEGPYRDAASQVIAQATESMDLQAQAFAVARTTIKYGDCFFEVVINEQGRLARGKILPNKSMWRNEDSSGNLLMGTPRYDADGKCVNEPGECAFDQRESMHGKMMAAFEPWQIVHFRWNRQGSDRYGRSMLRTARIVWKKLKAVEEAVVIARLQRAWQRFLHKIDTTGMAPEEARKALLRYREELNKRFLLDTQMRDNPMEVVSDFYITSGYIRDLDGAKFLPRHSDISILQGDHAALGVMADVEYFQNKLFASLRVPKAYLGFERDINAKATLTTQDIQFARTLRRIQSMLARGYKELFDLALILAGIDPTQVNYRVSWPAILVSDEERDAIIRRMHAEADAVYWQMGAPSTKYLVQQRFGMDDEAWEADLADAMADPPARVKVQVRMGDQTTNNGAQSIADAYAAASANGDIMLSPGDNYMDGASVRIDPSLAMPDAQTETGRGSAGNFGMLPSAAAAGEEGDGEEQGFNLDGYTPIYAADDDGGEGDDDYARLSNDVSIRRAQLRRRASRPPLGRASYQQFMSIPGVHTVAPRVAPPAGARRTSARMVASAARDELQTLYAQMAADRHAHARVVHGPTRTPAGVR